MRMASELRIGLFDLISCLSEAVDLVCPALVNHHERVAYIALSIGAGLNLPEKEKNELLLAGALHDIGAISLREKLDILQFETSGTRLHSELGYILLKSFAPLSGIADLVRFHHVSWSRGFGAEYKGNEVPVGSQILHLADRVAVLVKGQQEVLGQSDGICKKIREQSDRMFKPHLVEAFMELASREYFWFDLASPSINTILRRKATMETVITDMEGVFELAGLFRQVIDFRSRFTSTHSSGVSAAAYTLARLAKRSEQECMVVRAAGYLHDLGKLAVPKEILEKPAQLDGPERNIVKNHTYYTYRILETIPGLLEISSCAAFHHERLDGSGYPFHLTEKDISTAARIMAVADVFTAITEDRPYREGVSQDSALKILQDMARNAALDPDIVSLLGFYFEEVNAARISAQMAASREYEDIRHQLR